MHHLHRHHNPPSADAGRRPARRLLPVLLLAQLMVILDISALNVALPNLARDLRIAPDEISWTITSYSLLFGSLLLLGGRAADLLGRRRVFFSGLTVFTASSLASAAAVSPAALFAARAGQGLGAAMLSPAALSIIMANYHGSRRTRALGAWGAVGGAGAAVGVLVGGVLTQVADWRAIFYVNLPVALVAALAGRRAVPADPRPPRFSGLDLRGAAVATTSLAAVVYALSQAERSGWTSVRTQGVGLVGLAGLALFAAVELKAAEPLLRVQRLRDRAVGGGFALMLLNATVVFGTFVLTSLYLQGVLATGPLETGLEFLPLATAAAAGAHLGAPLAARFGLRPPMTAGFAAAAAGTLLLSGADRGGSYPADVLPGILVAGFGIGLVATSVGLSILGAVREDEAGMLSGLTSTGHEIGGTLGIAVLITIASSSASAAGAVGPAGIHHGFLATSAVAALGSVLALIVLPPARTFLPKLRLSPASIPVH